MRKKLRRGYSLVILAICIVIMLIIAGTIIKFSKDKIVEANKLNFISDLTEISDSTKAYYYNNNIFPAEELGITYTELLAKYSSEYLAKKNEISAEIIENMDENSYFYEINLEKIDIEDSIRGVRKDDDLMDTYYIAYPSFNVYYLKGVKINKINYYSNTETLSGKSVTDLSSSEDSSNTEVTSENGNLKVTKSSSYINKLGIKIETDMMQNESLYMSVCGAEEKEIVTNEGFNIFTFDSLSDIIDGKENIRVPNLNKSDAILLEGTYDEESKKYTIDGRADDRYINFVKYYNGEKVTEVKLDVNNYSTVISNVISSNVVLNNESSVIQLELDKTYNKIKEIRYEYVSKYVNGTLVNYIENSNFDAAYMRANAKRASIDDENKVNINVPKEAYLIEIMTVDIYDNVNIEYIRNEMAPYVSGAKVNAPVLTSGLTPVIFDEDGNAAKTSSMDSNWYAYVDQGEYLTDSKTSRWANAISADGSFWVWIPRYAYKINYANPSEKRVASQIDVVFVDINNRDVYGNDYTNGYNGYIVHPAFTSNVSKGGWDSELAGIWIAKYEAGFSGVNGIASNGESSLTYSLNTSNLFGKVSANSTKMTYPVFKPNAYSYNYVYISDAYSLSRALVEENNPYGFTKNANSHMIKNSEWGAASYLAQSKYGRNGAQVTINSKNLNNSPSTVYAVTGYSDGDYTYNTSEGMKASTTGNIYGIYDMSGGTWERTAGYINNGNDNLLKYGKKMVDENNDGVIDGITNKFVSIYTVGANDTQLENYNVNSLRKGEAIWETSLSYSGITSWFNNYSYFAFLTTPFISRGGSYGYINNSGLFAFNAANGYTYNYIGFRTALCVTKF